jgi:hypothetical protein
VSLRGHLRVLWALAGDVVDMVQSCVATGAGASGCSVHGRKRRPIVADVITADQLHVAVLFRLVEWQSFDCFKYGLRAAGVKCYKPTPRSHKTFSPSKKGSSTGVHCAHHYRGRKSGIPTSAGPAGGGLFAALHW